MKAHPFMTRCLSCGANITNLSLIPVIRRHASAWPVHACWEMSTYGATLGYLKKTVPVVHESEYFPGAQPGERVGGIVNQDVQHLSFEDASLDLITSSQVFEHVPDDLRGFAECYRVLRPGGALVFTVPLHELPETRRTAELVDGQVVFHGEPEYHDSRRGGPRSALTFWHHSLADICQRVSRAGFQARLEEVWISPKQGVPARVVYARKGQEP